MTFIGGISQGQKILSYVKAVIYDRCDGYGRYEMFMTYMYFNFFFIPLSKWNRRFYVKVSCCNAVYGLDQEMGKTLLRGRQMDITQSDLTLVRRGSRGSTCKDRAYEVWEECTRRGCETEEDFEYCPKYRGRL